jgi:hypothetical protein
MRYRAVVKTPSLVAALWSVSIALGAACGGKPGATARSPGGEGDDPATPFYDADVKKRLGSAPGSADCGIAPGTTMGAHFQAQKQALKGDGVIVEESFGCTARPDNRWDCEWSVAAKADAAAPAPEDPCAGAENPCAGAGGAFMIMATVGNDGSVDTKDVRCAAPG